MSRSTIHCRFQVKIFVLSDKVRFYYFYAIYAGKKEKHILAKFILLEFSFDDYFNQRLFQRSALRVYPAVRKLTVHRRSQVRWVDAIYGKSTL